MSLGWAANIEDETLDNQNFRTTLFTGEFSQLTVMSFKPNEEIGLEVHEDRDQFLRIEQGTARVELGENEGSLTEAYTATDGWAVIVPAGIWHNVTNAGMDDLKLYSVYSPSEHAPGTVHKTKEEADAAEHE